MSLMPGRRTLLFVSSGFAVRTTGWSVLPETMRLIDHAIRSRVVIGSMDTRGLMADDVMKGARDASPTQRPWEFQLDVTEGTGGKFVRDSNDLEGAVRQLAAAPKYMYILGFSPDSSSSKNGFHKLDVKLRDVRNLVVEARTGYYDVGAVKSQPPTPTETKATPQFSETETKQLTEALDIRPAGTAAPVKAAAPTDDEMVTTSRPATFKVQANLVDVPVVVRDRAGNAIGNLKQDDFHMLDKGKRQEIAKFAMVTRAAPQGGSEVPESPSSSGASPVPVKAAAPPARFVTFVFDDVHMRTEDLPQVRNAVLKYLSTSVGPQDRVALLTTSGRQTVDFTDRPDALAEPTAHCPIQTAPPHRPPPLSMLPRDSSPTSSMIDRSAASWS
jgi:hypothetical protein